MENIPQKSTSSSSGSIPQDSTKPSGDGGTLQTVFVSRTNVTVKKPGTYSSESRASNSSIGQTPSLGQGQDDTKVAEINAESEPVQFVAFPLLKQRLGYLWEKRLFTDVIFFVGREKSKIEAHRVILASTSEVFQQLLFKEGKPLLYNDKYVLYEDEFSKDAFEVFIKAMYTNEIPICLTLAVALEVFYATKKYSVTFLEDQILEHIKQLLTISNVFEALRLSTNAIELTYLAPICWKIIEEQTQAVLQYHLEDLDVYTFGKVLERDRLGMDEGELFQIAVKWAAKHCKIHGMKTTGKNKRRFLEPLMKHFRFTTMSLKQFCDVVVPSRVLDSKEIQHIQYSYCKGVDPKIIAQLPYKTTPRTNTSHMPNNDGENNVFRRFEEAYISNNEVPKICSDSAVMTPNLGAKLYMKKGGNQPKLKTKRLITSRIKHRT